MQNTKFSRIAVLTSGGDAPGMNAAIRSVVRSCSFYNIDCFGVYRGYEGLIDNDIVPVSSRDVKSIINKGGTKLKSARSKEFRTKEGRKKAYENLKNIGIDALVVIGGDGSFTGGMIFEMEFGIPVIGIPGTIDNDIYGTSHTLGYDTALNTVVEAIDKIRDTAISHNRLFFVEVMGRDAGHIALNAGIGVGAAEILIPEKNTTVDKLKSSLKEREALNKLVNIIIVAEGEKSGKNIFELAEEVETQTKYEVRVSVLGHMQRGGSPSCFDRVLGSRMGLKAVESILEGKTSQMVGIQAGKLTLTPFEYAIKGKSEINQELLKVSKIMKL